MNSRQILILSEVRSYKEYECLISTTMQGSSMFIGHRSFLIEALMENGDYTVEGKKYMLDTLNEVWKHGRI